MRALRPLTEAEAILELLRGEAASPRFRAKMGPALEALGLDWSLIDTADASDPAEAEARRTLLWAYRGPDGTAPLLDGFPSDVAWERVALRPAELLDVRYIRYPYWDVLSGGSRSPRRAAERIRAGVRPEPGPPTGMFVELADALCAGLRPPAPPIFVGERRDGPLVILEGHSRITAFALRPECVPEEMEVVLGVSASMTEWAMF